DGAVIGMTPFRETWPNGDGVSKLRLELDGYRTESVSVPLDRGVDLSFTLRKAAAVEAPRRKDKGKDVKDVKRAPAHRPAVKAPSAAPTPAAKPSAKPDEP